MKSNDNLGFSRIHEGAFSGDAGRKHTANVLVGQKGDVFRAECYIWFHDQDASKEGVRDRIAARGMTVHEALNKLLGIPHSWSPERETGFAPRRGRGHGRTRVARTAEAAWQRGPYGACYWCERSQEARGKGAKTW
jgi:hypothetical protein